MAIERSVAKKVRIADLVNGKYFYGSKEEMKPSYVVTPYGEKISRVNIIGTAIEKFTSEDGNYSSMTIDDGTCAISVRSFEGFPFEKVHLGSSMKIIGKLKEYNGELYVAFELMENVTDPNFELLSKTEILENLIQLKKIVDNIKLMSNQMDEEELRNYAKENYSMDEDVFSVIMESRKKEVDYKPAVLEIIQKMDGGQGVEIKKIFETVNLPENVIEKTLDELITAGDLYEPRIGFLKKV